VGFLIGAILFLLPFAVFLLWRRANPEGEPSVRMLTLAGIGVVLAVAGFVIYGFSRGMDRDAAYIPARIGPDGRVLPPDAAPRPPR
jgi:peptidoglycan/LPS O-acetylase OafA/YrhL